MSDHNEPCDFIVIGAGSASCVLASCLSENPRHRVLLLEAGVDESWIWMRIPAGIAKIVVGQRAMWRFDTEPSPGVNGRALFCPRGRCVDHADDSSIEYQCRGNHDWREGGRPDARQRASDTMSEPGPLNPESPAHANAYVPCWHRFRQRCRSFMSKSRHV